MNYLCSVLNHTYAILNMHDERLLSIKGNEIVGYIGKNIDDFLVKKHLRKCKLIGESNLGEKLDNGTWTGNLGLIQKGVAILYLKNEVFSINSSIEKWMNYLLPFRTEKFVIIQEISKDVAKASSKENNSDILNSFNFDLFFLFTFVLANIFSLSFYFLIKFLSSYQNMSKKRRKKKLNRSTRQGILNILINCFNGQWNLDYSKLTRISIFILFYSLHLWFIRLVIANNIKTNKVIVDQSILIKDENDALMTKRFFCLFEGETELSIALSSNSNILAKLYNQKNIVSKPIKGSNLKSGDRCIIEKKLNQYNLDIGEVFSIISENMIWLLSSLMGSMRTDLVLWFNSKPIFEMNYHFIIKNQKDLIDSYNKIIMLYTEEGLFEKFLDSLSLNSNTYLQSHTVYRTIEEFIKGNSKFTNLNTDAFKLLFIIYISFCLILLIINLLHYLLIKTLNFYILYSTLKLSRN